jgi:glycosyltransferase involved in cell wall biosynthesis
MSNGDGGAARRPLVTVGLVTYRQERFVREAVRSVLAQTYSPLQIVICDDASPDSTFDLLREEFRDYRGDHKITVNRNAKNLGIGNFNEVMKFVEGELIVIAHGDDISCPDRVDRLVSTWLKSGASLVSSNGIQISEDGCDLGPLVNPSYPKLVSLEASQHKEAISGYLAARWHGSDVSSTCLGRWIPRNPPSAPTGSFRSGRPC